jgi:hypothetical protein
MFSIIFLLFLSYKTVQRDDVNNFLTSQRSVNYAALPTNENSFSTTIHQEDARVELVKRFLNRYDSPLSPYAASIVKDADTYGLDFRLVPAIAMQESNLCKKMPVDSNNCWGFGIYGGKIMYFDTFEKGITTVTKALATKYKEKGLNTPNEIMKMYTPSSNGSWANGVNYFLAEIQ